MSLLKEAFTSQLPLICGELNLPIATEANTGVELSIGGYYWPGTRNFTWPYYIVFHDKGLVNSGQGLQVHGASCIRAVRTHSPMLAERFLHPLKGLLKASGHDGLIEAECVVDEKGNAFLRQIVESPEGERPALNLIMNDRWKYGDESGNVFEYLAQIRLWAMAGLQSHGFSVGRGKTPRKAFKSAEIAAAKLGIPELCYRTDGGIRVRDDLTFIERTGWLR